MTVAIRRIVLREVRLTLRRPFASAAARESERRILLVELVGDGGRSVFAECVALARPDYSPETVDTAWLALRDWLAPRVLGRAFASGAEVDAALRRGVRGHPMARAALEMGWWALAAATRGKSLAELLGGERERVETGVALGFEASTEALVERARAALEEGYRRVKVKIRPGADLEPLRALRRALGPEAPLLADANSAYALEDAEHLARLDDLDLLMIEQPLDWDDLRRHAELQRRLRTPICLDESITSPARAEDMIALGAGRVLNLKPGRVGGFTAALAIHDLCRRAGVPVWCGGMLESGVGRAYNVALASLPGFTLPGDLSPSARYWRRDLVDPEWTMDARGTVAVPRGPGIGVEVDRERVEALSARREALG